MISGITASTVHFEASRYLRISCLRFVLGIPHFHVARQTLSVPGSFAAILVDFPISISNSSTFSIVCRSILLSHAGFSKLQGLPANQMTEPTHTLADIPPTYLRSSATCTLRTAVLSILEALTSFS